MASYIGNADFRGYVKANAPNYLGLIGNNPDSGNTFAVGNGINPVAYRNFISGPGGGASDAATGRGAVNAINKLYGNFLTATGRVQGASTVAPTAAAAYDPAPFDQAIGNTQSAIDRLPNQLASGNSAINSSYQDALNQLLLGKNQANTAYKGVKQQTATDYVGAKNTIGANAGSTLSGLLRLLGSRGAGGGSAATTAAPGAVARGATLQRADAGNTFGANNQALDTNWGNYMTGYNNQVSSAGNQRDLQRQELQRGVGSDRAALLQSLATLASQKDQAAGGSGVGAAQPYLDQANSLLDRLSNYTVKPINYQTQAYAAPALSTYTTNPLAAPTYQGQPAQNDYYSPYLSALLGKKQPGLG